MSVELVDFHHYLGASIDRRENKKKGLTEFSNFFFMDLAGFKLYKQGNNPMNFMQNLISAKKESRGIVLKDVNLEMLLKVKTNLKLNAINPATKEHLISSKDQSSDEIHFVKFEGRYPEFELSAESIRNRKNQIEFSEWTIVDFDNFLKGNPHV